MNAINFLAATDLPTRHGLFRIGVFRHGSDPGVDHVVLTRGDVAGDGALARLHSECLPGEVLGSLHCDCAAELDETLGRMAEEGRGVLVYLRQEIGARFDQCRFDAAASLLAHLGIRSVRLLGGSPERIAALRALGLDVHKPAPHDEATVPEASPPP